MAGLPKKEDRNRELIKDYLKIKKEGGSMVRLVAKYRISSSRIYLILKREGIIVDNRTKKVYK